jgi:transcription-repair coupling factor (superfamily II helicase)
VLLRELQRGGQAFFVHNRVQNIEAVVDALQKIVPEARYGYAHGQMSERQLEPVMRKFIDKEIDVLIATSIIESGIDIPNANTILIDRADTFGLAQLYQLRGRVGRSSRQAFCYFLIPKSRSLSGEAQQRLKALQALDDLGLGFNLAMRDLEIRGAGNLLGKEQSGSVLAVGFELYSKILKEAILNLKGEEIDFRESIEPEVKLGIPAFVPEHYLPDVSERLVLYQRFASICSEEESAQLLEEVRDRFGPVPRETVALAELMSFRSMLREFGVVRAEYKGENLILSFSPQAPIDIDKLFALEKADQEAFRFGKNLSLSVAPRAFPGLPFPVASPESLARHVRSLLEQVRAPAFPSETSQGN